MTNNQLSMLDLFRAEHHALHEYLSGKILRHDAKQQHIEYEDLVGSHDAVAEAITELAETSEGLTEDEAEALLLSGLLAGAMRRVIGDGPQAPGDWREVAHSIHDIQARILSQVAARAGLGRPLGGRIDG